MAEQKPKGKTMQQRQEENHINIINTLDTCVTGEVRQTVIDFLEYCKENKLTFRNANRVNYFNWNLHMKGAGLGALRFRHKGGRIGQSQRYREENCCYIILGIDLYNPEVENFVINENLSEVVWNNVKYCEGCLSTCSPGRDLTLFGKTLNNVCCYNTDKFLQFTNPNPESMKDIIKLLEFSIAKIKFV